MSVRPAAASGARSAQQDVVGIVLAQHVVDQVGAEGHLAAGLLLAGMAPLDQAGDHGTVAEGALDQRALGHPLLEIVAQDVDGEQLVDVVDRLGTPGGDAVVRGDEAQRPQPAALHPPGQQHAQGLMRVAAGEAVGDEIVPGARGRRSRPAARPAAVSCERRAWAASHSPTCCGSRCQVDGSASRWRTRSARCVVSGSLPPA